MKSDLYKHKVQDISLARQKDLFIPKFLFVSRHDKRQAILEVNKLHPIFLPAEESFGAYVLMLESKPVSLEDTDPISGETEVHLVSDYDTLYALFLKDFSQRIELAKKVIKPKYWDINPQYFVNTYKPLEKE